MTRRWLRCLLLLSLWATASLATQETATAGGSDRTNVSRALVASYRAGQVTAAEDLAAVAEALIDLGRDDPRLFHDALAAYDRAVAADPNDP